MKKIYFYKRLFQQFCGVLFSALTVLSLSFVTAQDESVPPPAATSSEDSKQPLADNGNAPVITPIKGGFHIEWSTLAEVGGVRLLGPLAGKVELMFDVPLENIDKKIEPVHEPDVLSPLADYWIVRGKPEHAIPLYRLGLTQDPKEQNKIVFQNNLAMLLSTAEGNHAEGLKIIDSALEERRDNVTLLDTKGIILMNDGRASEAIPVLQRATELSCQHPIYCLHLAKAYDIVGQASQARSWFDKSRPKLESMPEKLTKENKNMFDDLRMKYPPETNVMPNL
jgi:tetratricopeptide (TPR) repeat protein